ncbi:MULTISPECIES: hypothetical protein [Bacillaceae]|jgi:hypothetical protein|uniref:YhjD n=2 Tax=Bacillaceae TaxID=186817 RepID=A0A090KQT9_9BACI|nr:MULTISPECIES: hypothetical protein [Bacillaceae]NWN97047.1 hypothetical protein [Bacillus sp. (in: firmicutes)]AWI11833.1 hypothetical protein CQJ30_06455 [Caldibacillus thermoamylovorans]MCB7069445.1 hypothetical protein [Caldibacillus sp. 210928-DFI.2.22]MCB7072866.1 hypothetical protein [Caldibacillus sp. 210928-DFI.2.18]MCM3055970.1 hypothetical protein [Caldibacillus thermoamylovorans]
MTRIPSESRDLLEKAIYYPMLIKVLEKDLSVFKSSPFKLPNPYIELVEHILNLVHKELYYVKRELKKQGMKVQKTKWDDTFTTYLFIYKGYEEYHSYFNPRLRNYVESLLTNYLFKRFDDQYDRPKGSSKDTS